MGRNALPIVVLLGLGCWAACGGKLASTDDTFEGGVPPRPSPSSSTSTSSGGGSSTSTSSSGSPPGDPTSDEARAACEYSAKCYPNTFNAEYASLSACVAENANSWALSPGFDRSCPQKTFAGPCGELAPECLKGTLATGTSCALTGQCASGNCKRIAATDSCGVCSPVKKEGDSCGPTDFFCGGDLRCEFVASKCVRAAGVGADCSGAAIANCAANLVCLSATKRCAKPRDIGEACELIPGTTISIDCRAGLACVDAKCADLAPKFLGLGVACDVSRYSTERCKSNLACVSGKCVRFGAEGEACAQDGTRPPCAATLTCNYGKCVKIEAACN